MLTIELKTSFKNFEERNLDKRHIFWAKVEAQNGNSRERAMKFYRNNAESFLKSSQFYITKTAAETAHEEFKRLSLSKVLHFFL